MKADPAGYAGIFFGMLVLVPVILAVALARHAGNTVHIVAAVANVALLALVWYYNSGPSLSLWKGFVEICRDMSSGCANITILYIFFLLAAVYLIAAVNAAIGVFKGRAVSQDRWHRLVLWFDLHSFR